SSTYTYRYLSLINFDHGFRAATSGGALVNLAPGANVAEWAQFNPGPINSIFYDGSLSNTVGFTSGNTGYIGFQFNPGGTVLYGWAEVVLTNGSGSFEVVQWAYEDSGNTIQIGATIPEPKTVATGLGLLALGSAGIRRW